jgi:hypothetical protein
MNVPPFVPFRILSRPLRASEVTFATDTVSEWWTFVSDGLVLQYVGFESKRAVREYAFTLRGSGGAFFEYFVTIPNDAFAAHRVRYQDAPDICSLRLHREFAARTDHPPSTRFPVTDAELAISNNVGVVKYCFLFFSTFFPCFYFSGHTNPLRSHERCLATAETRVSRERSQGRSGGFCRTVHRRPLTPRTAHHHGHRTKRKLRLTRRFRFGSALLADLTACHHPPRLAV